MNTVVEKLKAKGCDIEGVMERFLNDEEFYVSLLDEAINDPAFKKLGLALSHNDAKSAFEYAHTLKGVLGNMGLTSLYDLDCKMVEQLRIGLLDGVIDYYVQLISERETYTELIKKL